MKKLSTHFSFLFFLLLLVINNANASNGQIMFVSVLTGGDEIPSNFSDGKGLVTFLVSEDRKQVTVHGAFTDLSGPITSAHIHFGDADTVGQVIVDLSAFVFGNRIKGSFPLPSKLILNAAFFSQLYINVHTGSFPDGEIRGQLIWMAEIVLPVVARAGDEVPPVAGNAIGLGALRFSQNLTRVEYQLVPIGLSGPATAAHIHLGAEGSAGPVIAPLDIAANDVVSGTIVNDTLVEDIFFYSYFGLAYVNIHTAANPDGEIRGQVLLDYPVNGTALINGAQETPPVSTNAKAYGYAVIDYPNMDSVTYLVAYSGLTPTAAHIHVGSTGVAGPVIIPLNPAGVPGAYSGRAAIKDADLTSFLKDDLYFNIHTSAHPGGEIRGQILNNLQNSFAFDICGDQEVPKKTVAGYGAGFVAVNKANTEINYGLIVDALTGPANAAHIHNGDFGTNGPVVLGLEVPAPLSYNYLDIDGVTGLRFNGDGAYMNVHTTANPGGEVRGQVRRALSCAINVATVQSAIQNIALVNTLVNDHLIIKADADKNLKAQFYISDISGKQLLHWNAVNFIPGSNQFEMNVSELESGFYLINLTEGNRPVRSFKFVKQ